MKKVIPRLILQLLTTTLSISMFAQEHPKKQSAKELAEKGSRGDLIIGKREQKKVLKAPAVKINNRDSVAPASKKPVQKAVKNPGPK